MTFEELMKPTDAWQERMEEGEDLFTPENIQAANEVLDRFIQQLKSLGEDSSEQRIIECVKNVVLQLNEINETYEFFIETMEREELCEFIEAAVGVAGGNWEEDMTEEWREW
ncbi:hypothetical protein [Niallia sp. NCCP-28]|uniref:hypothetical protein n=1 Tax=Niallia sp. NCCP-28 TaxID=2934712 RepID=UPI0020830FD8|nr:hypothetical protein [Niallia sp. NCCP-28]GKU85057.1 hypothetical protein NCCP28_44530 [Niallia sp. NCCP-28]